MLEIVCEKSKDDLQISSEEAIMTVNKEVVVHESITIDEQYFLDETKQRLHNIFIDDYVRKAVRYCWCFSLWLLPGLLLV